jgi:hypothetical protein
MSNQDIDNKREEAVFHNQKEGKTCKLRMVLSKKNQLSLAQFVVKGSKKIINITIKILA